MQSITVTQPRAIVISESILFPGRNDLTEELKEKISNSKGAQKTLEKFARAGLVKFDDDQAEKFDTTDSLVGLPVAEAVALIEAETSVARLEKWAGKARGKVASAIKDQLELLKLEQGEKK